jgi:hypothetical protein
MTRKTCTLTGTMLVVIVLALLVTPGKPVTAMDPTLDAALAAIAQATARAQTERANQQATRAASDAIAIQQRAFAQATAQAQSAQATQSAMDELNRQRAATATVQVMSIEATRTTRDATATAEAVNVQATQQANVAEATRFAARQQIEAVTLAAQATDVAHTSATYATRQERFTFGLLIVEILFVCGAAWVLFRLARAIGARVDVATLRAKSSTVLPTDAMPAGPPPTDDELPTAPQTRVVYDQDAARRIAEILDLQEAA